MAGNPGIAQSCETMRAGSKSAANSCRHSASLLGIFAVATPLMAVWPLTAHAELKISNGQTQNMTCSGGICAPTAKGAVLNVGDLENLLASGNVAVTTTGAGVQADDMEVDAPLVWSGASALALDAYHTIRVEKPVSVTGQGGLSITTNDGGSGGYFGFGEKGHVTFANLSSALTINGTAYVLAGDIATLAADVAAYSGGNYALANDYGASKDGTYQNSPIPTDFSGNFEGLGNTISDLSLNGTGDVNSPVGLFAEVSDGNQLGGAVENINLRKLRISGSGFDVGGLVGINGGTISGAYVSGYAESDHTGGVEMGLLVGVNGDTITRSGAIGTVATGQQTGIGGLVGPGSQYASISQSYADVRVSGGANSYLGGLAAGSSGPIRDSYVMGKVAENVSSEAGGLVADNGSIITQSYSTTTLMDVGHRNRDAGGLIGVDGAPAGSITSAYWDTSTSHVRGHGKGAGTPKDDPGITGLTTQQFQSGLPAGFDPKIWAEDPKINNGLPYLIDNPPRK